MHLRPLLLTAILLLASTFALAVPGALDTTFGGGYFVTNLPQTGNPPFTQMAIQPNGKILVAVNVGQPTAAQITVYRFNADSTPDMSFGSHGFFTLTAPGGGTFGTWGNTGAMTLQPDGKILIAATNGASGCVTSRLNSNGSMDTSFGGTGQVSLNIGSVFWGCGWVNVQTDGKIVVAGDRSVAFPNLGIGWFVARYNSDGSLDNSFGSSGIVGTAINQFFFQAIGNLFVRPDGRIVLAASYDGWSRFSALQYTASGAGDPTFGSGGLATMPPTPEVFSDNAADALMQPDGKIVFVGNRLNSGTGERSFRMARMNTNGTPDATFGSGGFVTLTGPVLSTFIPATMKLTGGDGKILTAGYVTTAGGKDFAVVRFNGNGSVDAAKLVPIGRSKSKTSDFSLVKGETVFDDLWGSGGLVTAGTPDTSENITSMAVDATGRVVTAGATTLGTNPVTWKLTMARFLSDAAPTANIYGTIRTAGGIPIKNITVVLSEGGLSQPVYALTNQFGLYSFGDLQVTENYSISISSKRFNFTVDQQHVTLLHEEQAIDFTAEP
jgi:uncharacterized delta-60 repeat protein